MSNKKFNNLSEQELVDILNQGKLSDKELMDLVEAMKNWGLSGSIMAVDDPNSEEGKAAIEYIEYHKKLPESYYKNMPKEEIEKAGKVLSSQKAITEDKKRALMILAHTGNIAAYKILEEYEKNPDLELKIWINLAVQECQSFLKRDIIGQPVLTVGRITKVGRNDSCLCGSGKKFKKCCLNKYLCES
ncbi:SEC-C domain-containing protein [Patescibacteria group bacterium]|nr:SEC-C domain-containing protein [Patescibacteria group bacterium]MBU3999697.1 SEC-C domain-containing protein [Patescibacteria group bacterium]MBU4056754.1 SEC-C domain-containing protein [Patescibacteria group bacterium]MBU4368252.1 SEC-C domain-containing protein [Patescibacteria group bacterium]